MTHQPQPGTVRLVTADFKRVCDIGSILIAGMLANGKPPEIIVWGQRTFTLDPDYAHSESRVYVEGLAYVVLPSDQVIT